MYWQPNGSFPQLVQIHIEIQPMPTYLGLADGFDRARGEVVLAGGELNPHVDGSNLALAVPEVCSSRVGNVRQS